MSSFECIYLFYYISLYSSRKPPTFGSVCAKVQNFAINPALDRQKAEIDRNQIKRALIRVKCLSHITTAFSSHFSRHGHLIKCSKRECVAITHERVIYSAFDQIFLMLTFIAESEIAAVK